MRVLKASALYFAIVFGTGFLLGPIRLLWLVPRVGTRSAELMETPVMLVVIIVAARWTVQRLALPPTYSKRWAMGMVALSFMLLAEFSLVLWLRGMSLKDYFATRDPVSGTVYYLALAVFAVMPRLLSSKRA